MASEETEKWGEQCGKLKTLVGYSAIEQWLGAIPTKRSPMVAVAIRCLIDDLDADEVKELTNYCLNVERRKANKRI